MLVVPVQPIPNQSLQVQLNGQACTITIYQTPYGLFVDLYVGPRLIVPGVACENLNRIVRDLYLGFSGDLCFADTQAVHGIDGADPIYTGLGTRFILLYVPPDELPTGEG